MRWIQVALTSVVLAAALAPGQARSASRVSTPHQVGVDPHGRGVVSIPIEVSPGSGGMAPSISLTYNGDESGIAGVGWSLGVAPLATRTRLTAEGLKTDAQAETVSSAITRCPELNNNFVGGVAMDYTDRFCLDGQRLTVHGAGTYGHDGTEYRTEVESFTKAVSYGSTGFGPSWFKVWTKSGLILEYGNTTDSRILIQYNTSARLWALNKVSDRSGNYYTNSYIQNASTGEYVIDRIDYTGNAAAGLSPYNSVRFVYETRPDQATRRFLNLSVQQQQRLKSVQTYNEATLVKDYRVAYQTSSSGSGRSLATSVAECDGAGSCLPALNFGYTAPGMAVTNTAGHTVIANMVSPRSIVSMQHGDFNGDGHQDVWVKDDWQQGRVCYGPSFTAANCTAPYMYGSEISVMVLDWDGDGKSDLAFYYPSSGTFIFCRAPTFVPGPGCYAPPASTYAPYTGYVGYQWIAGDFNGDGIDDLFGWNTQNPAETWGMHCTVLLMINIGSTCNGKAVNGTAYKVLKGDYDGDGMADLLYIGTGGYIVCTGRSIAGTAGCAGVSGPNWRDTSQIVVGDFNGDGVSDFLRFTSNGMEQCLGPQFIWGNNCTYFPGTSGDWNNAYKPFVGDFNGDGINDMLLVATWATHVCYGPGFFPCGTITSQDWKAAPFAVADFTGDGSTDILMGQGTQSTLMSGATAATDRLASVTDTAFNITHSLAYRPLTDSAVYMKGTGVAYPLQDTQQPLWVVSQHTRPNGVGGTNPTNYKYEKGRFDASSRRFLGYEIVRDTDVASGRETVTTRAQTYPHFYRVSDRKVYVGSTLVAKSYGELQQMSSFENRPISVLLNWYDVSYGLDGSWKSDKTSYVHDAYGNVYGESLFLDEFSTNAFRKHVTLTLANDPGQWLFGQVLAATVQHLKAGQPTVIQSTAYTPVPGTRLVQQEIRDPNDPAMRLVTDYLRDTVGNVTSKTMSGLGIETRTESATYDAKKRFALTTTSALNHTTTHTYDARFGVMETRTDPNNLTTTWRYDGFGRKTQEWRPGGYWSFWSYQAHSFGYIEAVTDIASTSAVEYGYDVFGRRIAVQKRNFANSGWIWEDWVEYDPNGRITRRYLPTGGPATPHTAYTYDSLGRLATETASNGAVTTYSYSAQPNAGPVTTTSTNAKNQVTKQVRNVHGELLQVIDALNKTTTYEHSAHGKLARTIDSAGVQMTTTYNAWGWPDAKVDPSLGSWTFTYDVLGNLKTQTDAKGQTTTFTYDKLNRKSTRAEPSMTATWTWDTAGMGIGKLAQASTTAGVTTTHTYDGLGRPSTRVQTIDGVNYTSSFGYDSVGRRNVHTYPSGFAIKRVFNGPGYLAEVRDNANNALFWKVATQSPAGITDEDYGNGTGVGRVFDPLTHRVTQISTVRDSDGAQLQNYLYGYEPIGNMTSRSETTQGLAETYTHDALNRLWTVTGPAPKSYTYGDTGNIASKSDVGSYTYATPGKPHAVSAAGGLSYQYDANGNMISAGSRTIAWTSFNMPASVNSASAVWSWVYDADRQRVKYVTPLETVRYFADKIDIEMEKVDKPGVTEYRHYIRGAAGIVAIHTTRSVGASTTHYVYRDHLGSTTLLLDQSAGLAERLSYDASGKRRYANGADDVGNLITGNATDRGFTSHEHLDGLDLIHMNGRLYDPKVGRAISADALYFDANKPQSLNRYAYVLNDPLGYIDPTGFDPIETITVTGTRLSPFSWNDWVLPNNTLGDASIFGQVGHGPPVPHVPEDSQQPTDECTLTAGASATLGWDAGARYGGFGSTGVSVGFNSRGNAVLQAAGSITRGVGTFAGWSVQGGFSRGPTNEGLFSASRSPTMEINAGWGPNAGVTIQLPNAGDGGAGGSISAGRLGFGYGGQVATGLLWTGTLTVPGVNPLIVALFNLFRCATP